MKYLLILLALMPLAMGGGEPRDEVRALIEANDRSISSQIVDFIESKKQQMPCGFPGLGIPPLAPLKASHKDIHINAGSIQAHGEVNNFRMDGLDDFDIVQFKLSTLISKLTFEFNWNHVYLNTDYVMATSLDNFKVTRSGLAKFALKNLRVWGDAKYAMGIFGGTLKLKTFNMYMSVGEVKSEIGGLSKYGIINKKLNEVVEEWVYLAINDNTDNMSDLTNGYLVPLVNNLIGDMTLSDLLGLIGGGGGGGGDEGEKEVCVPPTDA
ncbi:uncharacterized protein LOC106083880 [Stomoxys calcitrans]|uniref:Uncharacterized protein n=1 Tax=Stomoxys calcitrans TaxID=35570 RepID=A0A1I8P501_STOCA|nr:uncharacterized protein LOC106083880 [Stomoxys calcitrans]